MTPFKSLSQHLTRGAEENRDTSHNSRPLEVFN